MSSDKLKTAQVTEKPGKDTDENISAQKPRSKKPLVDIAEDLKDKGYKLSIEHDFKGAFDLIAQGALLSLASNQNGDTDQSENDISAHKAFANCALIARRRADPHGMIQAIRCLHSVAGPDDPYYQGACSSYELFHGDTERAEDFAAMIYLESQRENSPMAISTVPIGQLISCKLTNGKTDQGLALWRELDNRPEVEGEGQRDPLSLYAWLIIGLIQNPREIPPDITERIQKFCSQASYKNESAQGTQSLLHFLVNQDSVELAETALRINHNNQDQMYYGLAMLMSARQDVGIEKKVEYYEKALKLFHKLKHKYWTEAIIAELRSRNLEESIIDQSLLTPPSPEPLPHCDREPENINEILREMDWSIDILIGKDGIYDAEFLANYEDGLEHLIGTIETIDILIREIWNEPSFQALLQDHLHDRPELLDQKRFLAVCHIGTFLHDIGKISIKWDILNAPRKLSDEEYARVVKHPHNGKLLLAPLNDRYIQIYLDFTDHHPKYHVANPREDKIPADKDISFFGALMAVADNLSALSQKRVYRPEDQQKEQASYEEFRADRIKNFVVRWSREELRPSELASRILSMAIDLHQDKIQSRGSEIISVTDENQREKYTVIEKIFEASRLQIKGRSRDFQRQAAESCLEYVREVKDHLSTMDQLAEEQEQKQREQMQIDALHRAIHSEKP